MASESKEPLTQEGSVAVDLTLLEGDLKKNGTVDSPGAVPVSRVKTILVAVLMFLCMSLNDVVLAFIHDRVPDRSVSPLPDLWFTWFPEVPWTIKVTETLVFVSLAVGLLVCLLHQHRWIAFRRVFFCVGLCYLMRAFCIAIFQVPVPSRHTYCAPKSAQPGFATAMHRMGATVLSLGMDLYKPRDLCGDLIVSGHTIILVIPYMAVRQYAPRRANRLLSFLLALALLAGIVCILFSRRHYTIDVVLAYFLTTRVFLIYHSLAQEPNTGLNSVWWFPLMRYLEKDAPPVVFNQFQWPSGCPAAIRNRWNSRRR